MNAPLGFLPSSKRLSHSSLELLQTCERKYQLERLCAGYERDDNEHHVFGRAFGAGVAHYMVNQDQDAALFATWMAYWPIEESDKKDQARCMLAVQSAFRTLDALLQVWEVARLHDGLPAVELGFRLVGEDGYHFVGFIDLVLKHRETGRYAILEVKHTGFLLSDMRPMYRNSGQALGYSIVLDRIAGRRQSSYGVLYLVAQLGKAYNEVTIKQLPFNKTLLDRLRWFIDLKLDIARLKEMQALKHYPKRGSSCLTFNKPCAHFLTCHLTANDFPRKEVRDLREYPYEYQLEDLIVDHMQRVAEEGGAEFFEELSVEEAGMYG